MAEDNGLSLTVQNFGPIKSGRVELKPLTMFIGPNNGGKSYLAFLTYALYRAISGTRSPYYLRYASVSLPYYFDLDRERLQRFDEHSEQFASWFKSAINDKKRKWTFRALPQDLQQMFTVDMQAQFKSIKEKIIAEINEHFFVDHLSDLKRSGSDGEPLLITLASLPGNEPVCSIIVSDRSRDPNVNWADVNLASYSLPATVFRQEWASSEPWLNAMAMISSSIYSQWLQKIGVPIPPRDIYYLPAARSGIFSAWQMLASLALNTVRARAGREHIEVASVSGVAGDFLQILLDEFSPRARRKISPQIAAVMNVLEQDIFNGQINLENTRTAGPRITYKTGGLELPINRASSMVAELAPLALLVKILLTSGDRIFIDEPEAHLHPENQRKIGRALVRLVRAGAHVICPTHSSTIVHQISNHLLAAQSGVQARQDLGFTDSDMLFESEVRVYDFKLQDDGTHIVPVPIESGFGIDEQEFAQVAESLGDETYSLAVQTRELAPT